MNNENKKLWNDIYKTNPIHTKKVEGKGPLDISINAYYQIERITELWGPYGSKWGVKNEIYTKIDSTILYQAILFYPDGEFPIQSDIEIICSYGILKGRYMEGWSKKVATDALTKGLSKIGLNADVFQGRFKDRYYVYELNCYYNNINEEDQMIELEEVNELMSLIDDIVELSKEMVIQGVNKKYNVKFNTLSDFQKKHYRWSKERIEAKYKMVNKK